MKTKHTKGPWIALKNSAFYEVYNESRFDDESDCFFSVNVLLHDMNSNDLNHTEENKANAKLIAAAPDLLEALNIAVQILESKNGYHKDHDNPLSIKQMKEAIKKATE